MPGGRSCVLLYPVDDGVPQKAGAAWHLFVVAGGEPLVHHIELRDPRCLAGSY